MAYIGYAGPLLLDCDFTLEFPRHPGKLGYHRFDLHDAAARFVDLEAPETCKAIPRLHYFNSKTQDKVLKKGPDFIDKDLLQLIAITRVLIDRMHSSDREMREPS